MWAGKTMFEEGAEGIEGGELEDRGLHEHITHWVEVLDRWVADLDRDMCRPAGELRSQPPVDEIGAGA
jgi:hypothetical protein